MAAAAKSTLSTIIGSTAVADRDFEPSAMTASTVNGVDPGLADHRSSTASGMELGPRIGDLPNRCKIFSLGNRESLAKNRHVVRTRNGRLL